MKPSWDQYFMNLAEVASTRATCDRKHIGAILVKDKRVIATGYNGSVPGTDHCDVVGHYFVNEHCCRTTHAEANAIAQAARYGIATDGATCYITAYPCLNCFKILASAGIKEIVYRDSYRNTDKDNMLAADIAKQAKITIRQFL